MVIPDFMMQAKHCDIPRQLHYGNEVSQTLNHPASWIALSYISNERCVRARTELNRATPKLRIYAETLIDDEISRNASATSKPIAAFAVVKKLGPHFGALMGAAGFRALLSRSLVLANAEVAWLGQLHVREDGSFEGLNEIQAHANPEEIAAGGIVLLTRLLGLLMTFIGEDLTLRLLSNVNDLKLSREDRNGKRP